MKDRLSWTDFKSFLDTRNISAHLILDTPAYILIEVYDGPLYRTCKLAKTSADYTEYQNDYQSDSNKSFTDSDGIPISRQKVTETGWHAQAHGIEFTTAKVNSGYNKNSAEEDLGFLTVKFYDRSNIELTTQIGLSLSCVKTEVYWETKEEFDIVGGTLYQAANLSSNVRMWLIGAPDISPENGGSIPFTAGGINLRHLGSYSPLQLDGKVPKRLKDTNDNGGTKIKMVFLHEAGFQHSIFIIFNLFKS